MKYIFVGAGPSNCIASILLKKNNPNLDVLVLDKNIEPCKKLRMTGNGRCNLAPKEDNIEAYNYPSFVNELFKQVSLKLYLETLSDIGVSTKLLKGGYYPISESAPNVSMIIKNKMDELGIQFIQANVIDYQNIDGRFAITTSKGTMEGDVLVIGTGGRSYPKTGSDGEMLDILKRHHYKIVPIYPSLCPVSVKENVKMLFGSRAHALIALYRQNEKVYEEYGELMFKKDGLSGIAIMNISSIIAHNPKSNYSFHINLLKSESFEIGFNEFANGSDVPLTFLMNYVMEDIALYLLKRAKLDKKETLSQSDKKRLYLLMSDLTFEFDSLYGFDNAQITSGGVDISCINKETFESSLEKNVYILGEALDIDAICGGYNLRFAISSGICFARKIH